MAKNASDHYAGRRSSAPHPLRPDYPGRVIRAGLLAAGLLLAHGALAAVRVQVLNLSPRTSGSGGAVTIDLGGQATVSALPYKGQSQFITLDRAKFTAVLRDEQGVELAARELDLVDNREHLVIAIGDGRRRAFNIADSMQHAVEFTDQEVQLQTGFYATVGSFADPVRRHREVRACSEPEPVLPALPTAPRPRDDAFGNISSQNLSGGSYQDDCVRVLQHAQHDFGGAVERFASEIRYQKGETLRVFAIGDGEMQPLEQLVLSYGVQVPRPVVAADVRMDGLWFDPERPGEGVSVLVDTSVTPPRTRFLYYGFDGNERSIWGAGGGALPILVVDVYQGGSPEGRAPAVPLRAGSYALRFHSCREASFESLGLSAVVPHTPYDQFRTRRLIKLLPLEDC